MTTTVYSQRGDAINLTDVEVGLVTAVAKTFDGYFSRIHYLNGSTIRLVNEDNKQVALIGFQGNVISRVIFSDIDMFKERLPAIIHNADENSLLKEAFKSFCSNDMLVHMINTECKFIDLGGIYHHNETEYKFYNSSILIEMDIYRSAIKHHFYYSYDKKVILGKDGLFHAILVLNFSLKQKNYSIYLSPELRCSSNVDTLSGEPHRDYMFFEDLFEKGLKIEELKYVIDSYWGNEIFFHYIDALLQNRPLVDSIFNSCSNYDEIMNLVEMNII